MKAILIVLLLFLISCNTQEEETNAIKKSYRRLVIKESNYDSFIVASSNIDSVDILGFFFDKKEIKYKDIGEVAKNLKVTALQLMGPNIDFSTNDRVINESIE